MIRSAIASAVADAFQPVNPLGAAPVWSPGIAVETLISTASGQVSIDPGLSYSCTSDVLVEDHLGNLQAIPAGLVPVTGARVEITGGGTGVIYHTTEVDGVTPISTTPALAIEPARTNQCYPSSGASSSSQFGSGGGFSVTPETRQGIDGRAVTVTDASAYWRPVIAVTPGQVYTFTFYAQRGTLTDMNYAVRDFTNAVYIVSATNYYGSLAADSVSRISITVTAPAGCTSLGFYLITAPATTGTCWIGGIQLESASSASALIPSTSAAVTRAAQAWTLPASWVTDAEGTLVAHVIAKAGKQSGSARPWLSRDASILYQDTSGNLSADDGTTTPVASNSGAYSSAAAVKAAVRWATGALQVVVDGVAGAAQGYDGGWGTATPTLFGSASESYRVSQLDLYQGDKGEAFCLSETA